MTSEICELITVNKTKEPTIYLKYKTDRIIRNKTRLKLCQILKWNIEEGVPDRALNTADPQFAKDTMALKSFYWKTRFLGQAIET